MKKANETATVKGLHVLSLCKSNDESKKIEEQIEDCARRRSFLMEAGLATAEKLKELWTEYRFLITQLERKFKTREFVVHNITTTVGRSALAQRLSGTTTYTGVVNYTALGDDNTAAVVGDATLGNETSRKALSSGTYSNNIAYLETFFTASEAVDTHEEYGMYIDGTGSVDTGQLFNRFTQQVVKSALETLNVQSIVTLADA